MRNVSCQLLKECSECPPSAATRSKSVAKWYDCLINDLLWQIIPCCQGSSLRLFYSKSALWVRNVIVSFSQGRVSTLFRWGGYMFYVCVKRFFFLTAMQKLFKSSVFPELWSQICCHLFSVHSVNEKRIKAIGARYITNTKVLSLLSLRSSYCAAVGQ